MDVNFLSDDRKRREEQERRKLAEKKSVRPMTTPHEMSQVNDAEHVVPQTQSKENTVSAEENVAKLRPTAVINEAAITPANKRSFLPQFLRARLQSSKGETKKEEVRTVSTPEVVPVAQPTKDSDASKHQQADRTVQTEEPSVKKNSFPVQNAGQEKLKKSGRWPLPLASIEVATLFAVLIVVFVSGLATGLVLLILRPHKVVTPPPAVVVERDEKALAQMRDQIRLVQVALIQESLDEYWRGNAAHYPNGNNVLLGSIEASCLGATGWTTHDRCAIPQSPSENRIYLQEVPRDPTSGSYNYTSLNGGMAYQLDFTLEVGSGAYDAGPQQVTGGAVSSKPNSQS
ncbi:MAG: hypothetical protein WC817_04970 [Patescibacteria group bacterium]|jgi:hypothetical protein